MLDLYDKSTWKNEDGFYNLVFVTGFIKNFNKKNQRSFDIQQTINKNYIRVIVKKGLNPDLGLENNHPINASST